VEALPNTNSVTIAEGIKLDAFRSNSFRKAPSRLYIKNILARVHADRWTVYLSIWAAVVDISFHTAMKAQIKFIVKVIHCDTSEIWAAGVDW
jgi:hypothetical protein